MKTTHQLGIFEGFPYFAIQARAELSCNVPAKRLQSLLVEALGRLNNQGNIVNCDAISSSQPVTCRCEIGIAEGVCFNFLSWREVERFNKYVKKRVLNSLDFLICILYKYKKNAEKEVPLWSDFHHVRFEFKENSKLEIKVHHSKGTRKIPLDTLIHNVVSRINEVVEEHGYKPLTLDELKGHY